MGAEITDAVLSAAVRQIVRVSVGVEGKFHNLHTRKAGIFYQLAHARGQVTEVFGNEVGLIEPAGQHPDQPHAGTLAPMSVFGSGFAARYRPVAVHPAEVVDAQHVKELCRTFNAPDPPAVAIGFHARPVVQRIAPELAGIRKGVGRNPGNLFRAILRVQLEELRFRPDVCGIHGHINRNISDEPDALFDGICLQGFPLAEKQELHKCLKIDLVPQQYRIFLHAFRAVHADRVIRPLGPAFHVEVFFDSNIEGIVIQPSGILRAEGFKFHPVLLFSAFISLSQERRPFLIQDTVICFCRIAAPVNGFNLLLFQQAVFDQQFQIDQVGIPCKRGTGGVGAVAVTGGPQGKQLPVLLRCGRQKINKPECFFSHGPDSIAGGQGTHRHQNTAGPFNHVISQLSSLSFKNHLKETDLLEFIDLQTEFLRLEARTDALRNRDGCRRKPRSDFTGFSQGFPVA